MGQTTLFGIANCDTIKKARQWLDNRGIDYVFYDYRRQGLRREQIEPVVDALGWEALLNRRGTTWRGLPAAVKEQIDRESAIGLMLDNPAIIKRPLLARDDRLTLGFDPVRYQEVFDKT